ncbi:endonuclease/exonuclease/phosphatase family protein [Mucilaginibacter gynuensis]|uniref:Endonuclease/exonuclease/phosphatase family protein n=1 Tax=Mucilaginibacter gynuensis TaxID=1302236 RepID=A0ABP8GZS3_9SPHI
MPLNVVFYATLFIIFTTLIPLIRHDFWIFRVFEYPRLQKLFLNGVLLVAALFIIDYQHINDLILLAAIVANFVYLTRLVYPFTRLGEKQLIDSRFPPGENNIKLLIANVYQENRQSRAYHQLIKECDPDVILMVETNHWWQSKMDDIRAKYPYTLAAPLENTYGLLLYSRLELLDGAINYLVEEDIPSAEVNVKLLSGKLIKLYCLHPQPPVPQENPRSTERDKEILIVAEKAKVSDIPVLVIGDLNDVAWSYTTDLFSKISGLLDPRKGRGFFNSFNAKYFFLRFPLDHIFCSADFTLTSIKRMKSCGSDHFPMCISLQYDDKATHLQDEPVATAEEKELADEKITVET